jgi:hypothetical protein
MVEVGLYDAMRFGAVAAAHNEPEEDPGVRLLLRHLDREMRGESFGPVNVRFAASIENPTRPGYAVSSRGAPE